MVRAIVTLVGLLCIACGPGSPLEVRPLIAPDARLDIDGRWFRCHELGSCVYELRLAGPEGERHETLTIENPGGDRGPLSLTAGFSTKLYQGRYDLTLVATLLGDTLQPNGERTILGEDARCEAEFSVGPKTRVVRPAFVFAPRSCTVEVLVTEPTY